MNVFPIDFQMLLGLLTALLVSWVLIPPVIGISRVKGLVAVPNGRTSHEGSVPTIGGVAIFASVVIGSGLFMPDTYPGEFRFLMPALVILFFIGLQDDMVGIDARKKLAGQVIASLIVIIFGGLRMTTLHGLFGLYEINYATSAIISLVIFVGLINAFNLMDGIDGLTSGLGIVISIVFGIWLSMLGKEHYAVIAFALAGSLIAFYRFNVFSKKNKLFMGDTGSMIIGFIFAVLVIKLLCCTVEADSILHMKAFPVVAISLMIIPVSDTIRVMAFRMIRGRFPFSADRTHCHHDLLRLGFTHFMASNIIVATNLGLFLLALILKDLSPFVLGIIMLAAGILMCSMPKIWLVLVLKRPEETVVHYHTLIE